MNLAFFHGQVDGPAALVTQNDIKFGAEGFVEQLRQVKPRAASAAGTALGRLGVAPNIFDILIRRVGAHVEQMFTRRRRTDECVFRPIVLDFLAPDQLIEVKRGRDPAERQPVGLGHAGDVVRGDHRACPRHILHDEDWITGNIFAHVLRDQPWPKVVHIAGGIAGDDTNCFALKVWRLGERWTDCDQ